ncbi:hypothetical protein [Micromonospora sp. CPCC 206061]|uniref:hypothetical protein n=1 Tax=Micromonospora sp. CPCC 206061 TaxID=3122410 RepID=UPI002FF21E77
MTHATSPHPPQHGRAVATPIRVSTYVHRRDDAVSRQQDVLRAWVADQPDWQLCGQYVDVRPDRQTPRRPAAGPRRSPRRPVRHAARA